MSKTAFLFPGQGAQTVGMGQTLHASLSEARGLYDRAGEILGYDLAKLCFEGPQEKLDSTVVSQPALFVTSLAVLESLRAEQPEVVDTTSQTAEPAPDEDAATTVDAEAPTESSAVEVDLEQGLLRNPYAEGLQREAGGDYRGALEHFEEVLAQAPGHLNALFHAAQAHTRLRQYDEALVKLYRALDKSGGRKDIYLTLGEVYRRQAQLDSARKYETLFAGGVVDVDLPVETAPEASEEKGASTPDELPWLLLAIAGSGFAVIVAVVAWVRLRGSADGRTGQAEAKATQKEKKSSGKFARALQQEGDEASQGKATAEEEVALDRQIDDKWRELKQSAQLFAPGEEGSGEDEQGNLDRILDNVESLRKALDMQDDRARIYAEIVRLQNMKIESMSEEVRLLRRNHKGR